MTARTVGSRGDDPKDCTDTHHGYPSIRRADVPELGVEQMRLVDRLMVDTVGVTLLQMMENAGRALADVVMTLHRPRTVTVLAGSGGNGGGGLAAARHLHNRGAEVTVVLSAAPSPGTAASHQLDICRAMGITIADGQRPPDVVADVVVDALVGYGLSGRLRAATGALTRWTRSTPAPVVALDAPSGVDLTDGRSDPNAVRATQTLTLALPKHGLRSDLTGDLYLADISVPPRVYTALGLSVPDLFSRSQIVRLV